MNYDNYKNKIKHPRKETFKKYYAYRNGKIVLDGVDFEDYKVWLEKNRTNKLIIEKVGLPGYKEKFRKALEVWSQGEKDSIELFKQDLYNEWDVSNNPKREKCFDLAWDRGHSEGLHSVADEFSELVELIY